MSRVRSRKLSPAAEVAELRSKHDRRLAGRSVSRPTNIPVTVARRYQVLGHLCAQRRRDEGLSLRDVSSATGISTATILRMEQGRRAMTENVIALSRWLNIPIDTTNEALPEDVPREVNKIIFRDERLTQQQQKSLSLVFSTLYREMVNSVVT